MAYYLNYLNDVIGPGASLSLERLGGHRILYTHQGTAEANGQSIPADEAAYFDDAVTIKGGPEGARIFRWELTDGPVPAPTNIETMMRMSRHIWSLEIPAGSVWIFRLDRINHPAPEPADCHTHPGPGIRALLSGPFIIEQTSESGGGTYPGDPWWETGPEAVISTPATPQDVHFLRGMLLPLEFEGRPDTAVWLRTKPAQKSEWKLYVDQRVTL